MSEKVHRCEWVDHGCSDEKGKESAFLDRKLLERRTTLISNVVDRELLETVVAKIVVLEGEKPDAMITLYINSPGGDADSGFAIYDALKFVSCPIRTICAGLCASAGIIIFLGGDPGERLSLPHSRFLIHQPSVAAQGQASDIEITAKEILKIRDRYNEIVSKETGVPAKQILKDANRDFWLSAEEAGKYGLVDRIVENRSEIS